MINYLVYILILRSCLENMNSLENHICHNRHTLRRLCLNFLSLVKFVYCFKLLVVKKIIVRYYCFNFRKYNYSLPFIRYAMAKL